MDYLYSLYDALVSISVPNDKARAVVDAMERDMTTTLATKADLQLVKVELSQEIQLLEGRLKIEICKQVHEATVRLGVGIAALIGLLFVALNLTL